MMLQAWPLERLKTAAIHEGIVESISEERLREVLHEEAVSFQAVKTWKRSNDPKFDQKVRRLRALTNREHNPPIVVAADEMGPLSLKPYGGHTWARSGHPDRVRATYKRTFGTRYLFGLYDYYHDQLDGFLSPSKHSRVWVRFLRYVRSHYPRGGRVYLINDNLSTHWTEEACRVARSLNIRMVATPTNASEYNPIEAHFGELKDLGLTASDYPSWRHLGIALRQAIEYRNSNATPKVHKVKRRF
jgi:transposase